MIHSFIRFVLGRNICPEDKTAVGRVLMKAAERTRLFTCLKFRLNCNCSGDESLQPGAPTLEQRTVQTILVNNLCPVQSSSSGSTLCPPFWITGDFDGSKHRHYPYWWEILKQLLKTSVCSAGDHLRWSSRNQTHVKSKEPSESIKRTIILSGHQESSSHQRWLKHWRAFCHHPATFLISDTSKSVFQSNRDWCFIHVSLSGSEGQGTVSFLLWPSAVQVKRPAHKKNKVLTVLNNTNIQVRGEFIQQRLHRERPSRWWGVSGPHLWPSLAIFLKSPQKRLRLN